MGQKTQSSNGLKKEELYDQLLHSLDAGLDVEIIKFSDEALDSEIERVTRSLSETLDPNAKEALIEELLFRYRGLTDHIDKIRRTFGLPDPVPEPDPPEPVKDIAPARPDIELASVIESVPDQNKISIPENYPQKKQPRVPWWAAELEEQINEKEEAAYDPLHRRRK